MSTNHKILNPILLLSITGIYGVSVMIVSHVLPEPTHERLLFNECSWEELSKVCEELETHKISPKTFYNSFKVYDLSSDEPTDTIDAKSAKDFIGQPRYLTINGFEHEVIVLGCLQDYLSYNQSTGKFSNPVGFTFQFNNLISQAEWGWEYTILFSNHTKYWESNLENALNSIDDDVTWSNSGDKRSVYTMIQQENAGCAIRDVYRSIYVKPSSSWQIDTQKTKLFEPVAANLFSASGLNKTFSFTQERTNFFLKEGKQYDYYSLPTNIGDEPAWNNGYIWNYYDCLVRLNCSVEGQYSNFYWLSTPAAFWDGYPWVVSEAGGVQINTETGSGGIALAPCFCI